MPSISRVGGVGQLKSALLRFVGLLGVVLFGFAFIATWAIPGYVEHAGSEFIRSQLEKIAHEKIDSLEQQVSGGALGRIAEVLIAKNQVTIEKTKEQLREKVPEKVAAVVAEMKDLSCECRNKYAQMIRVGMNWQVESLEAMNLKLQEFLKTKYMEVVNRVVADFRIFTGCNLAVFAVLLTVSFLKPQAVTLLFYPGLLLIVSTVVCSYFYLFEQNSFFTLLYNNFVGMSYLAYVGGVFLVLCDIALNRGRVTVHILNGLGSSVSAVPC